MNKITCLLLLFSMMALLGCGNSQEIVSIESESVRIEFNQAMESRIIRIQEGSEIVVTNFTVSDYLQTDSGSPTKFALIESTKKADGPDIGLEFQNVLQVKAVSQDIEKSLTIAIPKDFPSTAVSQVSYKNLGNQPLKVSGWVNNHYRVEPQTGSKDNRPEFWAYQGASYEDRRDWIRPLEPGFSQTNFLGMNASDYGGGTPVTDIWSRNFGMAVGHLEAKPKLVSLPVNVSQSGAVDISVRYSEDIVLESGQSFTTFLTFLTVHQGDYFSALSEYRQMMMSRTDDPVRFEPYPDSTYQPVWCAWGYERDFTMKQVYGTLPKAKELGFQWAVLDDGWQTAEGDWYLRKEKFPRGDRDMKQFTATIRKSGMRPKLWWVPLAVDPETDLIKEHPDYVLINPEGKTQDISWWNSYYLCPAYEPVREYTKALVRKILSDWDYDGLKIDGQHLNGVPPCHNPEHQHASPNESVEALPDFFKDIYDTALEIKGDAVVEICPCGTSYNFFYMPFMNQPVSSDPLSSWQIRHKGKTFKALMGSSVPYYGDHVELSDNQDDFASTIGIGAVPGSKFTWPVGAKKDSRIDLTPAKEEVWAKWLNIYQEKMLSKGDYLGELYDIGFDSPETHAIAKDGRMYYAFYADSFAGLVELRGLEPSEYQVTDYLNGGDHGVVKGPIGSIQVSFQGSLLLEAKPVQ